MSQDWEVEPLSMDVFGNISEGFALIGREPFRLIQMTFGPEKAQQVAGTLRAIADRLDRLGEQK
jgi:hypothetical protein